MSADTSHEGNKTTNVTLTGEAKRRLSDAIWVGLETVQGLATRDPSTGKLSGELTADNVNSILGNICIEAGVSFQKLPESLQIVYADACAKRDNNTRAEARNAAEKENSPIVHAVTGIAISGLMLSFSNALYEPEVPEFDLPTTSSD